jgi:hypothetical protein
MQTTPREEISAYDALPPELRARIRYAHFTISSKIVLNLYTLTKNSEMCIKAIDQIEQQMAAGVI